MRAARPVGSAGVWAAALTVAVLLAAGLVLRVWGADHGLPWAYNADENGHFVPTAIGLFGHGLNPHYFVNPPGYTYILHAVFAVRFDGGRGLAEAYTTNPTEVFLAARVTTAVLGTLAIWLLYLAGARLFDDRRVGVLAAGVLTFAFLPVFYAHLALNDAPTLAPLCLSLWGTAGVYRYGRLRDVVVAAGALGIACAFKYTAGIVLLPLLAAALVYQPDERRTRKRLLLLGLPVGALAGLAGFLAANPYALLDFAAFQEGLTHQSTASADAQGKLGLTATNGVSYYLWSLTWGLGWVPLLAVAAGVIVLLVDRLRLAAILLPAPVLFLLFMGTQERFFGRWLLPIYPLLALIAAFTVLRLLTVLVGHRRRLAPVAVVLAAAALWTQGVITSVHIGSVLSHRDTRNITRAWMVETIPEGTKIVVEPIAPDGWAQDIGRPSPMTSTGARWLKFPTSRSNVANDGTIMPGPGRVVNIEDFERTLHPGLIDRYERQGYCWVISGSTQRGRSEAEPDVVPRAVQYYRQLERRADLRLHVSPYHEGKGPVRFNFDWSFDFYPSAYKRPGPEIWVYRLRGGRCAEQPATIGA